MGSGGRYPLSVRTESLTVQVCGRSGGGHDEDVVAGTVVSSTIRSGLRYRVVGQGLGFRGREMFVALPDRLEGFPEDSMPDRAVDKP